MPAPIPSRSNSDSILPVLGSAVLIVACLYWLREILIPLTFSVLLTFILSPLVVRLQRRGMGKGLSVAFVVLIALTILGGLCWGATMQLRNLLIEIPQHRAEITTKINDLKGNGLGPIGQFADMVNDISARLKGEAPVLNNDEQNPTRVVAVNGSGSTWWTWVGGAIGSGLQLLVSAFFMALLVVFMLAKREDLRNRFFRAIGHGQLALMTRAVDEAAERISNYLMAQLLINLAFGTVWALALFVLPTGGHGLGLPYPLLWGALAAALRFVPYLGTWIALALPLLLSVALSPIQHPWLQPLLMIGIYMLMELVTANAIEPLLFGKHAGVSPIALLVAAVFWTWMWGPIGLVLSTPLTVCLVVLGKHVPGLGLLQVFLGEETAEETEASYYQRLLARDEDEAADLVHEHLKEEHPENVYDEMLVPALVLARRDIDRGTLQPGDENFIVEVTNRVVEEIVVNEQLKEKKEKANGTGECHVKILGCPARGEIDESALQMFGQLLRVDNCPVELLSTKVLTSEVIDRVREMDPAVVCIASLPPAGLAQASYLCKRLRWHFPELRIVVGRWGQTENLEKTTQRLKEAGASRVFTSLLDTRREILPAARVATAAAEHDSSKEPALSKS